MAEWQTTLPFDNGHHFRSVAYDEMNAWLMDQASPTPMRIVRTERASPDNIFARAVAAGPLFRFATALL